MSPHIAPHVLMVEDDPDTAHLIREVLADHFGVDNTTHVERLGDALRQDLGSFDLALCDLNLPDGFGLDLIERMLAIRGDLPIVVVTSESALDNATAAIRKGAYDYVVKAGDFLFTIPLIVEKNLAIWQVKLQNLRLQNELKEAFEELRVKNRQLEEAVGELGRQASTDPLTALANRRHIQAMLERGFAETARYGMDMACIMIDLDGFKGFNDILGHQEGDRMLQTMAGVLHANCRRCDVAGRYGGDEFVLLLPHISPSFAERVAARIKQQFVADARAQFPNRPAACDLSIGIACVSLSRPAHADQLIAFADAALYKAKQAGKARIFLHEHAPPRRTDAAEAGAEAGGRFRACSAEPTAATEPCEAG